MRVLKLDVSAPHGKDKLIIFLYTVGLVSWQLRCPMLELRCGLWFECKRVQAMLGHIPVLQLTSLLQFSATSIICRIQLRT